MISRDTSDARMPSCPIEIPSDTVIVPNSSGTPPARRTPSLAAAVSRLSDMLHGVISFHDEAMPICGLSQSSSVRPTARSIERAAAFWIPSVTSRDRGLMSTGVVLLQAMLVRVVPTVNGQPGVVATPNPGRRSADQTRRTSTDTANCWLVAGPIITPRTGVTSA